MRIVVDYTTQQITFHHKGNHQGIKFEFTAEPAFREMLLVSYVEQIRASITPIRFEGDAPGAAQVDKPAKVDKPARRRRPAAATPEAKPPQESDRKPGCSPADFYRTLRAAG